MRRDKPDDDIVPAAPLRGRDQVELGAVLEAVPDAAVVIDESGAITAFSSEAERVFGYTEADILGRNVSDLMPEPYRSSHERYISRYLETGEKRIIGLGRMVVGRRADGATFPMELAIGETKVSGRRHFIGFVRDVSDRQKTEARLQELQAELVHISRLTAMGEMASALAHELNQPLSAIANYLTGARHLMERSGEGDLPAVSDALDRATEQALRAGEIIRKLREFLSRGNGERRRESVAKLAEEAFALALVGTRDQDARVTFHIDPSIDVVVVDRIQIQQVMINLVRNAIEAMAGSERRDLMIANAVQDDGLVRVEVADTGPGLTPDVAKRLFQPFVTSKPHGMGVGLSISRTIVEAHGGEIWATSNPGGGVRFCFTLPRPVEGESRTHG